MGRVTPHFHQWTDHPERNQRETQTLNEILYQMDLIENYREFHPTAAEYTFLSHAHGKFSELFRCHGYKVSFGKFKKTKKKY